MSRRQFPINEDGKIEFTPAELDRLLNDVYKEGQSAVHTWSPPDTITTLSYPWKLPNLVYCDRTYQNQVTAKGITVNGSGLDSNSFTLQGGVTTSTNTDWSISNAANKVCTITLQ